MTKIYRIDRVWKNTAEHEVVRTGYTLDQAQEHCSDPMTSGTDPERGEWMDVYYGEEVDDDETKPDVEDEKRLDEIYAAVAAGEYAHAEALIDGREEDDDE